MKSLPLLESLTSPSPSPLIRLPEEVTYTDIPLAHTPVEPNQMRLEKQEIIFKNLQFLSDASRIFEDEESIKNLRKTSQNVSQINQINHMEYINMSLEYNFTELLISICSYAFNAIAGVDSLEDVKQNIKEIPSDVHKKALLVLKICTSISRTYSNYSLDFCNRFHEFDGIYLFLQIMANDACSSVKGLCRNLLGSLLNLSRVHDIYVASWNKLESLKIVRNVCEKYRDVSDFRITSYILMSLIASDNEINELAKSNDTELNQVLVSISKMIEKCATAISTKKKLKRINIQLSEKEKTTALVCQIVFKPTLWTVVELLNALYHLSVNDSIKYDIYFTHKLCDHLRAIIYEGTDAEITYALKLLNQLCFDQRIANHVLEDADLLKNINQLASKPNAIQKICKGILWLTCNKQEPQKLDSKIAKQTGHIMISYNSKSRTICVDLKKALESSGFKVWIDVESIHGSSLESMAKAVEESLAVLVCMSENYKQSTNCRAEAEYAFNLGKPIIPLIMQKGYKPDGWLGIILGSKIFVDFCKYEWDECLRRVHKELEPYKTIKESENLNNNDVIPVQPVDPSTSVINWSETQVEKWLNEKKINQVIKNNLIPINGKIMSQLYEMQQVCPEFFYCSISSRHEVPTGKVAHFAYELKTLFKK